MEDAHLLRRYQEAMPRLERLGNNVRDALAQFLATADIDHLTVTYRVKSFNSFYDKALRKGYPDPFRQTEDLCGVRIIAFYPSDVDRVDELVRREFDVHDAIDKATELGFDRFGYRSKHYVLRLKSSWLAAPNYRDLDEFPVELQVRTVLMHACVRRQLELRGRDN